MIVKYLKTESVCKRYGGVSGRTLLRWQETRNFPAPAMSGAGCTNRWLIADLEEWDLSLAQNSSTIDSSLANHAA